MTETHPKPDAEEPEDGNPVREMFILALFYLPLGFFLWFYLASALMWLPARLLDWVLTTFFPDLFERVVQLGFHFEIQTLIQLERRVEGQVALLNNDINPMIYAWGMALLFGLTMATPMKAARRALQIFIGYLVVSLVTVWGAFWETWTDLAFKLGPEAARAVAESSLSPTMIALFYQLGYLMLPAVVPLATWILMNRPFLEKVVMTRDR
ncbi:MAG: exosortase H-associated membrane protein [Wenzhouxiangellaceae bacterium]|nr:exosortase H-associated membrane protein [Wenzhouxiangellaceae bacterium]